MALSVVTELKPGIKASSRFVIRAKSANSKCATRRGRRPVRRRQPKHDTNSAVNEDDEDGEEVDDKLASSMICHSDISNTQ